MPSSEEAGTSAHLSNPYQLQPPNRRQKAIFALGVSLYAVGLLTMSAEGGCLIAAGFGATFIFNFILITSFTTAMLLGGGILIAASLVTLIGTGILLSKYNKISFFNSIRDENMENPTLAQR